MRKSLGLALVALCLAALAFGQVNTDLKGTISCWTWTAKAIEFVTPAFQKLYPNINIDVTPMSHPDTHDKLFVAIASGSGAPDLLTIDSAYIQKFIDQGGLVDMTAYINTVRNKFPAYKIANDSDAGGRVYAVPFDCGPVGYYYQKAIVDKQKIKLPETWAEFIALGRQLKAKGIFMNTISIAAAAMDQSMHGEVGLHGLLTQQQGGSYFDSSLRPTLNSKESIAAMKLIKQMVDAGISANVAQGSPAYYDMYNKGQVLGVMSAAWYVNVLNNFVEPTMPQFGNWRVAAIPAFVKGGVRASNLGGSEVAIATQTPDSQQEMAMAFIKWVCASLEGTKAHADYGEFPAFLPAYPTDIVQNKTFPILGDQKVYKLFAQITPTIPATWRIPPQYTQIQSILQAKMNAILTGKVTVEKGLQEAQEEALAY
jgi:lactose/L-arabinose transport system substrate-binding protein